MTLLVSFFGFAGRAAGDLLTSALGWASSLLFGRVPRSHQIFLVLMMAGSFLWLVLALSLVVPSIASTLLAATPHPPFVDRVPLGVALLVSVIVLPVIVGLAGYLVPAAGQRQTGASVVVEVLRGYLLTPLISALLIFLAGVGIARKIRSRRHGWSDVHVPIVVRPGGYDRLVADLQAALANGGIRVSAHDAPWVLTLPAWLLTRVAGSNVRKLRPDRVIALSGQDLSVGIYPSDIAISGSAGTRTRTRAAILSRLATTSAHMTTSAEAQEVEDRLALMTGSGSRSVPGNGAQRRPTFEEIDASLLTLVVPTDEWDILYRMRLQIERDLLVGAIPGTDFPGERTGPGEDAKPAAIAARTGAHGRSSDLTAVPEGLTT